jgi:hypothetical protein
LLSPHEIIATALYFFRASPVRDPEIWRKIKARTKGIAGVGLGLLLEIAKAEIKKSLGL